MQALDELGGTQSQEGGGQCPKGGLELRGGIELGEMECELGGAGAKCGGGGGGGQGRPGYLGRWMSRRGRGSRDSTVFGKGVDWGQAEGSI